MDSLPDFQAFAIFRPAGKLPDLDRIAAALERSERVTLGLAAKFPENRHFAEHIAATRAALRLIPEARAAMAASDMARLDAIAGELAALFTARGRADRLEELGLEAAPIRQSPISQSPG